LAKHLGKRAATPPARTDPAELAVQSDSPLATCSRNPPLPSRRSISSRRLPAAPFPRSRERRYVSVEAEFPAARTLAGRFGGEQARLFPPSKVQASFHRVTTYTCVRARCRCRNASRTLYEYLKFRDDTSRARARAMFVHGSARRENISICRCQRSVAADYRSLSRGARGSRCKRMIGSLRGRSSFRYLRCDRAVTRRAAPRIFVTAGKLYHDNYATAFRPTRTRRPS